MNFLIRWLDNATVPYNSSLAIDWARIIPFVLLHLSCLAVFWVGYSLVALITAVALFCLRIFSIGAFYHRYFSHRTYKTHRVWQFMFALLGAATTQRGPIWWAAHHRYHHQVSDTAQDPHSPWHLSFWKSHIGWFLSYRNFHYDKKYVKDWLRFPELRWIDRYDSIVPLTLLLLLFVVGELLRYFHPAWHCSGWQLVVWGFSLSTVFATHITVSINSFGHKYGKRSFDTEDHSRNNWLLAILTFGEGWHNNHHRYPATAQQGFEWWEFDLTFYLLWVMEKLKIIRELKRVPKHILAEKQQQ